MTEAEWLIEQRRPQAMVSALRGTKVTRTKAGNRQLRLFACGCCRLAWELLHDPRLRQCVEVAEQFAEAQAGKQELAKAYNSASELALWVGMLTADAPGVRERTAASMARSATKPKAFSAAFDMTAYPVPLAGCHGAAKQEGESVLCQLLRCVFGNPFCPAHFTSSWRTANLAALAGAIFEERAFDRLPILADALEDAGCTDATILAHCRQPGEHARGCWVVDLVTGKE